MLLIREDRFEVVARQVASRDADPNYGPEESDSSGIIPPLASRVYPTISIVHVVSEKRTLDEVLRDLASTAEQNIVLAPQAGEKGKMTVTARMLNVRFEIALKLLADMADLQVVKRGNVWLFTSNVHAATMEAQAEKAQQTGQNAAAESTRGNQPLNTKGVLARQEDVHGLLLDLLALQIVEQQRRLTILQPDQQVKDHDRLEKLEEAVRELVEREKMRRIENRQKPGASPFNPDPQPVEKKP